MVNSQNKLESTITGFTLKMMKKRSMAGDVYFSLKCTVKLRAEFLNSFLYRWSKSEPSSTASWSVFHIFLCLLCLIFQLVPFVFTNIFCSLVQIPLHSSWENDPYVIGQSQSCQRDVSMSTSPKWRAEKYVRHSIMMLAMFFCVVCSYQSKTKQFVKEAGLPLIVLLLFFVVIFTYSYNVLLICLQKPF